MVTYLINKKLGDKIEVLESGMLFSEGMKVAVPNWSAHKFFVDEVVMFATVSGNACSLTQNVFLGNPEDVPIA